MCKRLIRRLVWVEMSILSRLHVIIDRGASRLKDKNFDLWKRWLLKSMRVYEKLNGFDKSRND